MNNLDLQGSIHPITDVIKTRRSVRTYVNSPLSVDHKEKLSSFMKKLQNRSDAGMRWELIESDLALRETGARLGTYGVIRGATSYIVSALNKNFNNIEGFGYSFEQLILFSTALGLGTCWMAMTMNKNEFAKAIALKDDEFIPIVTPVGYPQKAINLADTIFRATARSNTRKRWAEIFFRHNLSSPLTEKDAGPYATALEMLRLAPSASNHQPWRVIKLNDNFHFYLQRTRGYRNKFEYDIQRLDVGIAMSHFELTLNEQGIRGSWLFNDPGINIGSTEMIYIKSWLKE